jgi:hypothetical protein
VQAGLQALVLDAEQPSSAVDELWKHLDGCDSCALALAHDRALQRRLARLGGVARPSDALGRRVRALLLSRRAERSDGGLGGESPQS